MLPGEKREWCGPFGLIKVLEYGRPTAIASEWNSHAQDEDDAGVAITWPCDGPER